eukprot:280010-Chlamydomonas_euryale.AAC.1
MGYKPAAGALSATGAVSGAGPPPRRRALGTAQWAMGGEAGGSVWLKGTVPGAGPAPRHRASGTAGQATSWGSTVVRV